jgi:uncharacterized protein
MRLFLLIALTTPLLFPQSTLDIPALQKAAEQGDAIAQLKLAKAYEDGAGVAPNDKLSIQWLRRSADAGNADAQNSLGVAYRMGRGVPKDFKEAVSWYRKAAKGRSANAMFNLGTVYFNGEGEFIDDEQSLIWFILAERAGAEEAGAAVQRVTDAIGTKRTQDAYMKLGDMYEQGIDIPPDAATAAKVYMQFQNHPPAQMRLARLYSEGRGVATDQASAFRWCERAAKANYAPGVFCAADRLHNGIGVGQDVRKAAVWYEKAGLSGFPEAFYRLGLLHASGALGKADAKSALMYQFLASMMKVPNAREEFDELAKKFSSKDVDEIKKKAGIYWSKNPGLVVLRRK